MKNVLRDQLQLFIIESPCIDVCEVNNRGYCKGCFRSREERFHWNRFTNEDKSKIIKLCRRRGMRKRKKGVEEPTPTAENLSLF